MGDAARQVAESASALARLELELAGLEVKQKLGSIGLGAGLGIGAAIFALFALGFGLAAASAGLATTLPMWASLLIVSGAVLLLAALLGFFASRAIKKGAPPVPEQAIEEARKTSEVLKANGD
jgi:Flp pilus assembly protein TadB